MSVAVGIDVGTSAVKAIAVTEDGEVVERREVGISAVDAAPRLVRAEPGGLVAGDRAGARRDRRRRRASGSRARCTAWSRSTRPTACSARRSCGTTSARAPSARRSRRKVGFDRLIELTGNRALTGFTAPKLLWLRKHEPDVYARIAHILLPKDYVRLRLTGERAIDVADASGTLLLDVAQRRWSEEVVSSARARPGVAAARARVARGVRARRRPASRSRRARAIRRRARSASASTGPGRCRSCSARRASCSPRCRPIEPIRRPASTRSATPCRARGTRWA